MKTKTFFNLFAVITFCVVMAGCEKPKLSEYQEILFKVEYINNSHSYSHSVFFIDKNGNIKTYSYFNLYHQNTEKEEWNFPDKEGFISEDAMKENLDKTNLSDKKVDLEVLQKYTAKILSVKYNDYTERHAGYDMGARVNVCYFFDKKTKMYKEILLSQIGDWEKINNNSVAKEIDNWLNGININLTKNNMCFLFVNTKTERQKDTKLIIF